MSEKWIEIEATAIQSNLHAVRNHLQPQTKILAVIKANAYGHGLTETAAILESPEVYAFGVTTLSEGTALRKAGVKAPILLFAPLLYNDIAAALDYRLTPTVSNINQLDMLQEAAAAQKKTLKVHVKIETGMGRTGLWNAQISEFISVLMQSPNIKIEGIYSHLAQAGSKNFSQQQYEYLLKAIEMFEKSDIDIPIKHLANSAGALNYPQMQLDMVRIGTLLFGQKPPGLKKAIELKETWKPKAKVLSVRDVPAGWPIGYGGDFITKKQSRIGVVPIGLADGFNVFPVRRAGSFSDLCRNLAKETLAYLGKDSKNLGVYYEDKFYPLVGRVGMQLSMIDFSGSTVEENHIVEFALRRITASPKIPRVYMQNGIPYKTI